MATQPTVQYGDKITAGYAPGQSGTAVYDPNTGKPLAGAQTYNPNTGKAITSELLKNSPTLILPDAPNYSYGGVQGATEALTNQTRSAEQLARDEAKANSDSSLQQLIQETLNAGNISTSVDRTAQNEAKQRSDLYTSQLEQEQLANRRAIEAIQSGAGIKTAAQRDAEAADINRKSLSKQADIAILQTAANRDYETAASIADRQVALKLEQSNARIAALKFFYEQNKADFTTQDDRLYANKIKEEERAYKKQEENLNDIKNLKLTLAKNGAPASALASLDESKDLAEALNNPKITQYFTSPADKLDLQLKRLQLAKASADLKGGDGLLSIDEAQKLGVPYGTTQAQAIALQGGIKPLNDIQKNALTSANELLARINNYAITSNAPVGIGKLSGLNIPGSKRADFIVNFDNLKSLLSLDNVKLLKGQGSVSDAERQLLASASSNLSRSQSLAEFKKNLEVIINTFQKADPSYQYAAAAANLAGSNSQDSSISSYTNSLLNQ